MNESKCLGALTELHLVCGVSSIERIKLQIYKYSDHAVNLRSTKKGNLSEVSR